SVLVHPVAGVLIAALLVRTVLARRRSGPVVSVLGPVGVISFSLYLWHYPVLRYGVDLFGLDQPGRPALAVVAGLAVLVLVSGALAAASYRLVERPFLERKPPRTPDPVPARLGTRPEWVQVPQPLSARAR
ncbi:MAG: acyltransferase family protein, partial [Acidimicrobiia bacterium]